MAKSRRDDIFPRDPEALPVSEMGEAFFRHVMKRKPEYSGKGVLAADGNPGYTEFPGVKQALREAAESTNLRFYLSAHGMEEVRRDVVPYFADMGIRASDNETQIIHEDTDYKPGKGELSPANVIPGLGVTNLYSAIMSKIEKDARQKFPDKKPVYLMTSPTYGLYTEHPDFCNLEIAAVAVRPEHKWHLQPEDVARRIREIEASGEKKVVAFYNMNPHNPTGAVLHKDEVEKLAEVFRANDVFVIDDMVYRGLEHRGQAPAYPFAAVDGMFDRSITFVGLAKAFCAPGVRSGVACGRKEDIDHIAKEIHRTTQSVPVASQMVARAAFSMDPEVKFERDEYFRSQRRHYQFNQRLFRALLGGVEGMTFNFRETDKAIEVASQIAGSREAGLEMLKHGIPGVKVLNYPPESGYFMCVDFSGYQGKYCGEERIDNSNILAAAMMSLGGTTGIPSGYMLAGKEHPMMMRFSFAANPERTEETSPENLVHIVQGIKACLEQLTDTPNPSLKFSLDSPRAR